jgi:hypothetical protein
MVNLVRSTAAEIKVSAQLSACVRWEYPHSARKAAKLITTTMRKIKK